MRRISAIFISACMVLIAACIGAALYLGLNVDARAAAIVALAALIGMVLYNTIVNRLRDRGQLGDQIGDLSRGTSDLSRQMAEMTRRLNEMDEHMRKSVNRARGAVDPLAIEIGELGTLVKQLAETVAGHEAILQEQGVMPERPEPMPLMAPIPEGTLPLGESETIGGASVLAGISRDGMSATIAAAIDNNRIDLYLQPIVTLPQRKVRYYEALSRLRTEQGDVVPAAEFIEVAETSGLMPKLDNLLMFRCVQVMRRLQMKNRDVGLFCNVSATTLQDVTYFRQFLDFMDANRVLGPSMLLEFTHAAYRSFGPLGERVARRACRARLPLLARPYQRPAARAQGTGRPRLQVRQGAGQDAAVAHHRRVERHPSRGPRRSAGALRHRSGRRAHRERKHGGRSARLRRALRSGLPVLAAAAGARRGAAKFSRRTRQRDDVPTRPSSEFSAAPGAATR